MLFDEQGRVIEDVDLIKNALSTGMGNLKVIEVGYSFKDPESGIKREVEDWFFLDDQSENTTDWRKDVDSILNKYVWVKSKDEWERKYLSWCVPPSIKRYKIKNASNSQDSKIREERKLFEKKWKEDHISEIKTEKFGSTGIQASDENW